MGMAVACEAEGTLSSMVISGHLFPSVKVSPLKTATLVGGNTAVADSCF